MENLDTIRTQINEINQQLLSLFIQRMELSAQVATYKKANNLPILDRKREEAILQNVADNTPEAYRNYALEFFRTLMDLSKDYQNDIK